MISDTIATEAGLEQWEQYFPEWLPCRSRDAKLHQLAVRQGASFGEYVRIPDGYTWKVIDKRPSAGLADPLDSLPTVAIKVYKENTA